MKRLTIYLQNIKKKEGQTFKNVYSFRDVNENEIKRVITQMILDPLKLREHNIKKVEYNHNIITV